MPRGSAKTLLRCGLRLMLYLALSSAVSAYIERVHRGLTEYLLLQAGFNQSDASAVARADNDVDTTRNPLAPTVTGLNNRTMYHFVTDMRLEMLRNEAARSCNVTALGEYLHALEDHYSHEGFGPVLGHFFNPSVDYPENDVDKALRMAQEKFRVASNLRTSCPGLFSSQPAAWAQIQGRVRNFLADPSQTRLTQ